MPQNNIADELLGYLQQEEPDYAAAARLGDAAMPLLKDIIKGSDERLASKATSLAGMIDSDNKTDALGEAARHPSVVVRVAAAAAADKLQPEQAEKVLRNLVDDTDVGVSKFTLKTIQNKNLSRTFQDKLQRISDSSPEESIKTMAKEALSSIR
jgi:HEAT repeat protein